MSYNAIICRIQEIKEHPNADKLNLATLFGNQVVIGKETKEGDLGVYFPTDGQLSHEFCHRNNLYRKKELNSDSEQSGFFEENRRIRTQPFRGELSDGFWLPISSLDFIEKHGLKEGDQFNCVMGIAICNKYINSATLKRKNINSVNNGKVKMFEFPLFREHVDTKQLAYNIKKIPKGKYCVITEKLHGTSGRTSYTLVKRTRTTFQKLCNKLFGLYKDSWKYVSGSRRVIFDDFSDKRKAGYYGTNDFRKYCQDKFAGKLHKGETVYYEIVGWVNYDKPIMGSCNNSKMKDKEFIKRYGDKTIFSYNCPVGFCDVHVYRMTFTNEDGHVVDYSWEALKQRCDEIEVRYVPELTTFIYNGDPERLLNIVNTYNSGSTVLYGSHIKEGVVLRIESGTSFHAYKHKSYEFKVLSGIMKDDPEYVDIEENFH